ncbi:SUMF1/EgtB/PvdO family nonheme iron enzyme [Rhizobium sp. 2YAF20]|uniref:SUMF1/EgtB/PvdO family nonheme iron enzyme n=1 Tax=Rhizobium sp. 2YAF20 TaxID=3233027 RepID=UPI003F95572D
MGKFVTFAQIAPDPKDYPGALPHMLRAGSLVFNPPSHPVDTLNWSQWWASKFGANRRRPYRPHSSFSSLDDHPVVHIAYRDAEAYAKWIGTDPPTKVEFEFAARRGGVAFTASAAAHRKLEQTPAVRANTFGL